MQYKTIDLCAGIGGIRRGFELCGEYVNVAAAEIDELACKTYEHLFGDNPKNNITSEDFKISLSNLHYDVLLGGFPCQAFSRVGLREGFKDTTKGTIFFDIAEIIEKTTPKVVFLENVENLVNHDHGNTFKTIIETLELELDYKVIGVSRNDSDELVYAPRSFIRNSKFFGIPQNRPRVYIIAFSRSYFGEKVCMLPNSMPEKSDKVIYQSVNDVLEAEVSDRFFLSEGYLQTLEDHRERQKNKGYGFGYRIVNLPEVELPIASTLLATGGSGRERNLILDVINGEKYGGTEVKGKYSPINKKNIRTMTPTEWGRLQGFIGYAFVDKDGIDMFSFPEGIPNVQKYKQFGNSVTIPVIEEMARFISACLHSMTAQFSDAEKRLYSMYGTEHTICHLISEQLGSSLRPDTLNMFFDLVFHFGTGTEIRNRDIASFLNYSSARASQIINKLIEAGCVVRNNNRTYSFQPRTIE